MTEKKLSRTTRPPLSYSAQWEMPKHPREAKGKQTALFGGARPHWTDTAWPEGIVSKMGNQPYRSGKCDWSKTKTQAWVAANRNRADLFE